MDLESGFVLAITLQYGYNVLAIRKMIQRRTGMAAQNSRV